MRTIQVVTMFAVALVTSGHNLRSQKHAKDGRLRRFNASESQILEDEAMEAQNEAMVVQDLNGDSNVTILQHAVNASDGPMGFAALKAAVIGSGQQSASETDHPGHNPLEHLVERPLMNAINVLRIEFCLRRPDLMSHAKCLEFLLLQCKKSSSGYGYCRNFEDLLHKQCEKGDQQACTNQQQLCQSRGDCDGMAEPPATTQAPTTQAAHTFIPTTFIPPELMTAAPHTTAEPTQAPTVVRQTTTQQRSSDSDEKPPSESGPAPAPPPLTGTLTKSIEGGLPEQGYDEHSHKRVEYKNDDTMTEDWRNEWPEEDATEEESVDRICKKQPKLQWCKLWLKDRFGGAPSVADGIADGLADTSDMASEGVDKVESTLPEDMGPTSDEVDKGLDPMEEDAQASADKAEANMKSVEKGLANTGDQAGEAGDKVQDSVPEAPEVDVDDELAAAKDGAKRGGEAAEAAASDVEKTVEDAKDDAPNGMWKDKQ